MNRFDSRGMEANTLDADPGFVTGYRLVLAQGVVKSDSTRP
jgi:hypothetical protein